MNGLLVSLQDAVVQGVLWGIMVLGVYITYKLLDIADLTVDGSFALGLRRHGIEQGDGSLGRTDCSGSSRHGGRSGDRILTYSV